MKKIVTTFAATFLLLAAEAQQVAKKIVLEHFTNTYCSICASRNPGLYSTISQFSEVLHIAYHTSAPYASCTLNQYNKSENDARANFYGVFGSTPRIVLQGQAVPASTNYGDNTLYQSVQNQMTSFTVNTTFKKTGNNSAEISVIIKKVDTSSLTSMQLYAVVIEDTVFLNAPNGEDEHYDVFRKSVWGTPQTINAPMNVGDSVTMTETITIDAVWATNRTYITTIIQDDNKNTVQAERSATLDNPVSINEVSYNETLNIYPNPATNTITIHNSQGFNDITIRAADGRIVYNSKDLYSSTVDVSGLTPGVYFLSLTNGDTQLHKRFLKQ